MDRSDIDPRIQELHFITPIVNVPSILSRGILSNKLMQGIPHTSAANSEVQERREQVKVPSGLPLHQYANLYIDSRNPMLYTRMTNGSDDLCVLRIDISVMTLPGVVVTDENAARDYVQFLSPSEAMAKLDIGRIYSRYWNHDDDPLETWIHKGIKCTEVLVPHHVRPEYIAGAYVPDAVTKEALRLLGFDREISVKPDHFFNKTIRRR